MTARERAWSRRTPRRALSGGLAAVVALPVALVLARADGLPVSRQELSGGGAWLASPSQGLVTLIDGASEQVVGSVRAPGARAGDELSVLQAGSSAYIVNPGRGTVSRVDGGTYAVSQPVRFGAGGRDGGLQVYPGRSSTYIVDGRRRLASVVDPVSMVVRQRLSLAAQPGSGQSGVDDAGRLWVVDGGGLAWFDAAGKHVRSDVGGADARLVLVRGRPVLVDVAGHRVGQLADDGTVRGWSCLDLRTGERLELLGATDSGRVLAAIPATGVLAVSGVGGDDCGLAVEVGDPGDELGPLVESGGFVLVPNRTSGRTVVVDVAARRVVADLEVVKPGARLQLLAKDGLVFYNDLDSDRAGVIRLDGGQWRVGRGLRKYERSKTGAGILTASGEQPPKQPEQTKPGQRQPTQDRPEQDQPDPATPPRPGDPGNPAGGDRGQPPGGPDPSTSPPVSPPALPPPPQAPIIRSLTWTPDTVVRDVEATFRAKVDNVQGATWTWTVLDPATGGSLHQATTPVSMKIRLPTGTPANLQIRLEVRNAVGAATPLTLPFNTTTSRAPQIDSLTASTLDAALSQDVAFSAVESVAGDLGRWTWTITDLDTGRNVVGPVAGQPQQGRTDMFAAAGRYRIVLSVSFDGATDQRQLDFQVRDKCTISGDPSAPPVDLRSGSSSRAVGVSIVDCFGPTFPGITEDLDPYLAVATSAFTRDPATGRGGQSVQLRLTGDQPPRGGQIDNAVRFTLRPGGPTVGYAVLVNLTPVVTSASCAPGTLNGEQIVTFTAFATDDQPPRELTVFIDTSPWPTQPVDPADPSAGFRVDVPVVAIRGNPTTWRVEARDTFGQIGSLTRNRGSCW